MVLQLLFCFFPSISSQDMMDMSYLVFLCKEAIGCKLATSKEILFRNNILHYHWSDYEFQMQYSYICAWRSAAPGAGAESEHVCSSAWRSTRQAKWMPRRRATFIIKGVRWDRERWIDLEQKSFVAHHKVTRCSFAGNHWTSWRWYVV